MKSGAHMRIFCTVTGTQGHANEVLPIARALLRAGHEVAVAVPDALTVVFDQTPVQLHPVMPSIPEVMQSIFSMRFERDPNQPELVIDNRMEMILWGGGPHITGTFHTVLPLAREFRPDLILRDGGEVTGVLIAEALGVPHVSCPSGPTNVIDPEGLLPLLNKRRAEVGLPAQDDPWSMYRYGRVDCMPAAYSFARYAVPEAFAYRQPASLNEAEGLPAELADLAGDRPLVVASVGSSLPTVMAMQDMGIDPPEGMIHPAETLRAIVGGLSALDCHAVVGTAGFPIDGVTVGANVHLMDWIPQMLLLQCAQLFITHAGYNSVREAVRQGIPMVSLPQFGDMHHNAARIDERHLGRTVNEVTPEGVAAVAKQVLHDDRITAGIRSAHRQMLGLPGVEAVVGLIERTVDSH
ncbi:macrolide-inactivating glycosyltransferase [Micromonospora parathelypteridis]|nr:macrolide-inactivating glycosyltransferase [Micromonospora parathelypteridis]